MGLAVKKLHAGEALERYDVARQRALRNQQRIGRSSETAVLCHTLKRTQCIQGQPAPIYAFFAHIAIPILTWYRSCNPMPFFDAGSQFLGFVHTARYGSLPPCRTIKLSLLRLPSIAWSF